MKIRETSKEFAPRRAEGNAYALPYDTELASSAGVHIHFWVSDEIRQKGQAEVDRVLKHTLLAMQAERDIVSASFSYGQPESYWANSDFWTGQRQGVENPNPSYKD